MYRIFHVRVQHDEFYRHAKNHTRFLENYSRSVAKFDAGNVCLDTQTVVLLDFFGKNLHYLCSFLFHRRRLQRFFKNLAFYMFFNWLLFP